MDIFFIELNFWTSDKAVSWHFIFSKWASAVSMNVLRAAIVLHRISGLANGVDSWKVREATLWALCICVRPWWLVLDSVEHLKNLLKNSVFLRSSRHQNVLIPMIIKGEKHSKSTNAQIANIPVRQGKTAWALSYLRRRAALSVAQGSLLVSNWCSFHFHSHHQLMCWNAAESDFDQKKNLTKSQCCSIFPSL